MKPIVYVETSVVSYYTARPSRDIVVLAHQKITRAWWVRARDRFDLVVSEIVVAEASSGDPVAAEKRLNTIADLPALPLTEHSREVARHYLGALPLPPKAERDAAHLAVACVNAVDYLVTWNCTHIANALLRRRLTETNSALGLATPVICTPEELMEE